MNITVITGSAHRKGTSALLADKKDVMILTGAGQIGMAIARRMGYGMKIIVGDKSKANAEAVTKTMNEA